ncbi:MAG: Panacea domain-containing protein [Defluviitaleaceae bacterium]|nr:Panacea domain-containing protein [Defluviitaleaceae bacterium]
MFSAVDIARYFLAKDPDREIFSANLIERNGAKFYEGNGKLNKFLHLSQNMYIARFGTPLFVDDLFAYTNGAVALDVMHNYATLQKSEAIEPNLEDAVSEFLNRMFHMLKNASVDDLIELSHEDEEWAEKHGKKSQKMDSVTRVDEYKKRYKDALIILYRMDVGVND